MAKLAKKKTRNSALHAVLVEAEEAHYKDCPNAELSIRVAAFTLDLILIYLAETGLQHLCDALSIHLGHLETSQWAQGLSTNLVQYLSNNSGMLSAQLLLILKLAFLYFYMVWATVFSGGTAGKLLLGVRVLDEDTGKNLTLGQALSRQIVGIGLSIATLGFGFILAFLRSDRKALHDLLAGSVVKRIHGAR